MHYPINHIRRTLLAGVAVSVFAVSQFSYAGGFGKGLESTISGEENLNQFRSLMARTHVVENLPAGSYTVFAPVDAAFAEIPDSKYPCFYAASCKPEQADILRNHIVSGEINLSDAARGKGGVYSVDKRHVGVAEPTKGEYYVDGHKVLSSHLTSSGMLYVIDGVLASDQELVDFRVLKNPPVVETTTRQTTVESHKDDPASSTVTTTTTTTKVKKVQ